MALTTKGRYAVRALYELAVSFGKDALSTKAISERQKSLSNIWTSYFGLLR